MLVTFNSKKTRKKDGKENDQENRRKKAKIKSGLSDSTTELSHSHSSESESIDKTPATTKRSDQNTSLKVVNNTSDFFSSKSTKRSKNGCLTCKFRKKKCDEGRPTCSDCHRLNKECIWVDHDNMSEIEIKLLKEKVGSDESQQKLRKRKSKSANPDSINKPNSKSLSPEVESVKLHYVNTIKSEPTIPRMNIPEPNTHISDEEPNDLLHSFRYSPVEVGNSPNVTTNMAQTVDSPLSQLLSLSEVHNNQEALSNAQFSDPQHLKIKNNLSLLAESASQNSPDHHNHNHLHAHEQFKSPISPSAFLSFIKDLTQNDNHNDEQVAEDTKDQSLSNNNNNNNNNNFSGAINLQFLDFNQLFSGSSTPNFTNYLLLQSPFNNSDFIPNLNSFFTPLPPHPPSYLPELANPKHAYLYNYYVETLSKKISIAPSSQNESNSYQKVFLPLAHKDKGVLYGILAWAGFHLGGEWQVEGAKYVDLALQHLMKSLTEIKPDFPTSDSSQYTNPAKDRQTTIIKLATLLILCGAEICKGDVKNWSIFLNWGWKILYTNGGILNFNQLKEEHWLISNFAYHDLLSSSSTERGTYFPSKDYEIIFRDSAGYSRGNLNPLLGVSKKLYRIIGDINTLLFESKKIMKRFYDEKLVTLDTLSPEGPDPVSTSPLYQSLDDSVLDHEDLESQTSEHGKINRMLSSIIEKAHVLDLEIQLSRPEPEDLQDITDDELEWQLTLFEAFQLSARLFLKQSILKCNPSMLEMQIINTDLIKCIDVLLETPVQASLVFPIFISGIHCVATRHREMILSRMSNLMKLYGPWNIQRAKFLVERVWQENPLGDRAVDWHSILKDLGWDINFA